MSTNSDDPLKEMLIDDTGNGGMVPVEKMAENKQLGIHAKLTQYEIAERRRQVMRLRLRGLGIPQIAKILSVSEATVDTDLQEVQKLNQKALSNEDKKFWVAEGLATFQSLEERAWAEYSQAKDNTLHRIKALELLRGLANDKIGALVDTGIIQKNPETQVVEHYHKLDWDDGLKSAVAEAMLKASLKTKLLEPTVDINATVVAGMLNSEIKEAEIINTNEIEDLDSE